MQDYTFKTKRTRLSAAEASKWAAQQWEIQSDELICGILDQLNEGTYKTVEVRQGEPGYDDLDGMSFTKSFRPCKGVLFRRDGDGKWNHGETPPESPEPTTPFAEVDKKEEGFFPSEPISDPGAVGEACLEHTEEVYGVIAYNAYRESLNRNYDPPWTEINEPHRDAFIAVARAVGSAIKHLKTTPTDH